MNEIQTTFYESEIGVIIIIGGEDGIRALEFLDEQSRPTTEVPPCLKTCYEQLDEYFHGKRKEFQLQLKPEGTDFQQRVWHELLKIPSGHTVSYLDIAKAIGNRRAVRAVGAANGKNKIPIIIPCHRVIGSDGSLIGFGAGIWRKKWLLQHEKIFLV